MSKNFEGVLAGLNELKKGAFLMAFICLLFLFSLFVIMLWSTPLGYNVHIQVMVEGGGLNSLYLLSLASLLIILVSGASSVCVLYRYWYKAATYFEEYDWNRFEVGRIGILLVLIGGIILMLIVSGALYLMVSSHPSNYLYYNVPNMPSDIISLYMMASWFYTMFGFIGVFLVIIGIAMFSIMLTRLSRVNDASPHLHTGGIILLMGAILSIPNILNILGFVLIIVANIIVYVGAKESIEKIGIIV